MNIIFVQVTNSLLVMEIVGTPLPYTLTQLLGINLLTQARAFT